MQRLLTIAGTDSGGEAGVAMDLRTFARLHVRGACVVTAVTAQNPAGLSALHVVPAEVVGAQLRAVFAGYAIAAVKTGMLPTRAIVEVVDEELARHPGLVLVIDPVLYSTSGARLMDDGALAALIERLLPRCTVLTPNVPEAERLAGRAIASVDDMIAAARALRARGPHAVLVKGGHAAFAPATDVLVGPSGVALLPGNHVAHARARGTGCMLASAIAAHLAAGSAVIAAARAAKAMVEDAIRESARLTIAAEEPAR